MDELLETLGYLLGFWRFVSSKQFRGDYIATFKRMGTTRKSLEIIGAIVSTCVGLGLPVLLVYLLYINVAVRSNIDSCLDSGGGYNYQNCKCDNIASHPYIEKHQCK